MLLFHQQKKRVTTFPMYNVFIVFCLWEFPAQPNLYLIVCEGESLPSAQRIIDIQVRAELFSKVWSSLHLQGLFGILLLTGEISFKS